MAQSLQPWICTYLINVAETYGGDLIQVPVEKGKKIVQVVQVCQLLWIVLRVAIDASTLRVCSSF